MLQTSKNCISYNQLFITLTSKYAPDLQIEYYHELPYAVTNDPSSEKTLSPLNPKAVNKRYQKDDVFYFETSVKYETIESYNIVPFDEYADFIKIFEQAKTIEDITNRWPHIYDLDNQNIYD